MGEEIRRKAKVVHKHETAANWALSNYVPEIGEIVFYDPDDEFDYTRQKNGNGKDKVSDLPFTTEEVKTYVDTKTAGYFVTASEGNVESVAIAAGDNSATGLIMINNEGVAIRYQKDQAEKMLAVDEDGAVIITRIPRSDSVDLEVEKIATEEYVDNAIANIDIPGGEATIPDDLTINSLVIGEGIVDSTGVAGGTTDTSYIAAVINGNSELKELIRSKPGGSVIIGLIESGVVSSDTLNTINSLLGTNLTVEESEATAPFSIALGTSNKSTGTGAVTMGYGNTSSGFSSSAIGSNNIVTGGGAFAYGYKNTVNGDFGTAVGQENIAGNMGFVGGVLSEATGKGSIAFGNECKANADYSIALGGDCIVEEGAIRSAAIGNNCTITGRYSMAVGNQAKALANEAFACNYKTEARGAESFACGSNTKAIAPTSFAAGYNTEARGENSFVAGQGLTSTVTNQIVLGQFNTRDDDAILIVGNGTSANAPNNAFVVKKNGTSYLNGKPIATQEYIDQKISALRDELKAYINEVFLNGAW